MAGDSTREFNVAVRECLESCYRTDLPVAALAQYVELLRRRDWTPSEIHQVEAAVTKILLAVVSPTERDELVRKLIRPSTESPPAPLLHGPGSPPVNDSHPGFTRS